MNRIQFLRIAKMLFNDFHFEVGDVSIHATKKVPTRTFRDENKSTVCILGSRNIFISGEMYPNTDKDFIYCIIYTLSEKRGYRCKNWYNNEHNKVFVSAKNYELLYEKLKEQVDEIKE